MIEMSYRSRMNNDLTSGDEKPRQHCPDSGQYRHARQRGLEPQRTAPYRSAPLRYWHWWLAFGHSCLADARLTALSRFRWPSPPR